ncbi:hypothetical protein [Azohydromonas australica]|uniref:hypothetical protein n=1 Tax=Azohydromonas australica TaxID=364039 RepID=UPI000491DD97|nr:hypothetical protein [Azohydromonas australica]
MKKLLIAAALAAASSAFAGDFYTGIGLPGLQFGYAQPVSESLVLRADVSTLGHHSRSRTEDNLNYDAKIKADRLGLFADWYFAGNWRAVGGLTFTNARADLRGSGNGATITIGNTTYTAGPNEGFDVAVKFPRTMPYLGIGYGRGPKAEKGWSLAFDLGVAIGKPKVSGSVRGTLLSSQVSQADIDRELAEIRDDADSIKGIPQLSLAVNYRF